MKDYKNYIFDLYATLVDIHTDETKPELWRRSAAFLRSYGLVYAPQTLRRRYLAACKEAEKALLQKLGLKLVEIDLLQVFVELLLHPSRHCATDMPVTQANVLALARQFALFFRETSREYLFPYPSTHPVLAQLRAEGKHIYLLSNAQSCFTRNELALCGLSDAFDAVYLSSEHEMRKPEPKFLQKLLDEQRLNPEESLFIGNDFSSDIILAQSYGLDSVYLNTFAYDDKEIARQVREQDIDTSCVTIIRSGVLAEAFAN